MVAKWHVCIGKESECSLFVLYQENKINQEFNLQSQKKFFAD